MTLGDWRLNNLFTADDEDGNTHFYDMDRIAIFNQEKNKNINQQKVYLDAYEQVSTPGGERYPEVTKAINDAIFQGNFVYAYMGHGGAPDWPKNSCSNPILKYGTTFTNALKWYGFCYFY